MSYTSLAKAYHLHKEYKLVKNNIFCPLEGWQFIIYDNEWKINLPTKPNYTPTYCLKIAMPQKIM